MKREEKKILDEIYLWS